MLHIHDDNKFNAMCTRIGRSAGDAFVLNRFEGRGIGERSDSLSSHIYVCTSIWLALCGELACVLSER